MALPVVGAVFAGKYAVREAKLASKIKSEHGVRVIDVARLDTGGAAFSLDDSGLIEVAVHVSNINVRELGKCAADDVNCGHIHLNLDELNCRTSGLYNSLIVMTDGNGNAEGLIDASACVNPIFDRPVELRASLSTHENHMDRTPAVQSAVTITLSE